MSKPKSYILTDKNDQALKKYMLDIKLQFNNPNTIRDHKEFNIMLLGAINKDYDKITL